MTSATLHTWVQVDGRELLAHVHTPEGGLSRGAVVLVEGIGRDQATARRAQVLLADRVARAGFTAVRFHLSGTVDSADPDPDDERDAVARWEADILGVLQRARELVPGDLRVVGLRVGGLLTLDALARSDVRPAKVVVWEPVGTGRTWLRMAETLHRMSAEYLARGADVPAPEGHVETVGILFPPADAAALRGLSMPVPTHPLDLVLRRDALVDRPLSRVLAHPELVTEHRVDGMPELLDVASAEAVAPLAVVDLLAQLATADAGDPLPADPWPLRVEAVVRRGPDGEVRERIVDAAGFHGIETVVPGATSSLVTVAGSAEAKDGPTGLWTRLARDAASFGYTSLRADRTDVGEDVDLTRDREVWPYAVDSPGDAARAVDWFARRSGHRPAVVGLCSGAWIAQRAADRVRVDDVIAVNQVYWSPGADPDDPSVDRDVTPVNPEAVQVAQPLDPMLDPAVTPQASGVAPSATARLKDRVNQLLKEHLPYPLFLRLAARGLVEAPGPYLPATAARGTALHLVLCEVDSRYWRRQRGDDTFDAIRRSGGYIAIDRDPGLDHSLFAHSSREATLRIVERILRGIDGRRRGAAGR